MIGVYKSTKLFILLSDVHTYFRKSEVFTGSTVVLIDMITWSLLFTTMNLLVEKDLPLYCWKQDHLFI